MTDLAETIERVERGIQHWSLDGHLSKADAEALLATARRVQAMDAAGGLIGTLRAFLETLDPAFRAVTGEDLRLLLDLASDQSAARARVRELETLARKLLEAADLQKRTGHWVAELATAVAIKELTAAISPEPEEKR